MESSIKKRNSLGFFKSTKNTKVVVAMSGGVDSSTVAGLMIKEGYEVNVKVNGFDRGKVKLSIKQAVA